MRFARFLAEDGPRWARVDGEHLVALDGAPYEGGAPTGARVPLAQATLLAPVTPSKIVAVASNYPKHAAEMGKEVPPRPRLFLKPPSALVGPGAPITIPPETVRVDPEGELAVVIGRRLSRATAADAMAAVFGYTCLNDVTCRDFQKEDGLFARAKGFDTFCPVGPWIDTALDPRDVALHTAVNGEIRAQGRTSDMHFDVPTLLVYISAVMTLEPGDVIATGTPPGVAPIVAGDRVAVFIDGVGTLENPVADREDRAR